MRGGNVLSHEDSAAHTHTDFLFGFARVNKHRRNPNKVEVMETGLDSFRPESQNKLAAPKKFT